MARHVMRAVSFAAFLLVSAAAQAASNFKTIFSFDVSDGETPNGTLIADKAGDLLGVTMQGGPADAGTIFALPPHGRLKMLYSFDGTYSAPSGPLLLLPSGTYYGTASAGGYGPDPGCGAVFKMHPRLPLNGAFTTLYVFQGPDGCQPAFGVTLKHHDQLYGITATGGTYGDGVLFQLNPETGVEMVLHAFGGPGDGAYPSSGLTPGIGGNYYGTTSSGGLNGLGTVYQIAPDGTESLIYSFTGQEDGAGPTGGVIQDDVGNLYGVTSAGGDLSCVYSSTPGCGVVFKILTNDTERTLHTFNNKNFPDSYVEPTGGVIMGAGGTLYGNASGGGRDFVGFTFQVTPSGKMTVLHNFKRGDEGGGGYPNGITPVNGLVQNAAGALFGTTSFGGKYGGQGGSGGGGTIFRITP
jgi:uncharacterized repeat protein (TIGR03803 family)